MPNVKQLDAFEVAKDEERARYQHKKNELERAKQLLEDDDNEYYDSGLSEIENRNEIHAIKQEIEDLEDIHMQHIESLTIPTVKKIDNKHKRINHLNVLSKESR